jgi:O-acetyl-ADP-ribose deacetylase (regulator of RNase III)
MPIQFVETALAKMRNKANREGIKSIAIPRIGVGYGGLSWKKVRAIIEKTLGGWKGTVYVYEEYAPEEDEPQAGPKE